MSNQIPHVSWLTGQFLIFFEKHKNDKYFKEVNDLFLKQLITEPKLEKFSYANYGLIVMLCYSLMVFPKEYWDTKINYKKLENFIKSTSKELNQDIVQISDLFSKMITVSSLEELIKNLRNSISHADVEFDSNNNKFIFLHFWHGKKIFEAEISTLNLSILLSGIGKYFCNIQEKEIEK